MPASHSLNLYPLLTPDNPANTTSYRKALEISPVLRREASIAFNQRLSGGNQSESKSELPDNSGVSKQEELLETTRLLLVALREIQSLCSVKFPITLVRDSCFTNHLLEKRIQEIL